MSLEDLELSNILKTAQSQGQGGINTLDRIFKSRIKIFSHKEFKKVKNSIVRNSIYCDLSFFDFSSIIDKVPTNSRNKPGVLEAEEVLENLKDMVFISSTLEKPELVKGDLLLLASYEMNDLKSVYGMEDLQSDMNRIYEIFTGPLSNRFLHDVIQLVLRDSQFEFLVKETQSDFPKGIYNNIVEKYRIDRQKYQNTENEKLLNSRMNALFQNHILKDIEVYNTANSDLFHNAGFPLFKYIIPLKIIKNFISVYYLPFIVDIMQNLQLEAEFFNKTQKTNFQEMVEIFDLLVEKIRKFEEDLASPSFSEVLPFIEALKNAFLDGESKSKARKAVTGVNERADSFIQDTFSVSINLHKFLTNIVVDVVSANPKILSNAMFLNHKKRELCQEVEKSEELFNKFIKLLRIFAVHVNDAKKSMV